MKRYRIWYVIGAILLASVVLLVTLPQGMGILKTGTDVLFSLTQNGFAFLLICLVVLGPSIATHYLRKATVQPILKTQTLSILTHLLAALVCSTFISILSVAFAIIVINGNVQVSEFLRNDGFHVPIYSVPASLLIYSFIMSFVGYTWKNLSKELVDLAIYYGEY